MKRKTQIDFPGRLAAAVAAVALLGIPLASHAARYTIEPVDGGKGKMTPAYSISPNGKLTGDWCCNAEGNHQPFVARNDHFRKLPVQPGETAYGIAINNAGVVIGESYSRANGSTSFYEDSTGRHLIGPDGKFDAKDINKTGQIPGTKIDDAGFDRGAFIYSIADGSFTLIEGLGAKYIHPVAISNTGSVAGEYEAGIAVRRCFIHQNGVMANMGDLGSDICLVLDMNDKDVVVGYVVAPDDRSRAFIWENGAMKELLPDSFQSWATAINNKQQIVGLIKYEHPKSKEAFLFEKETITLLKDMLAPADAARWRGLIPRGISDRGEIMGVGYLDAEMQTFIMRPVP